MVPPRRRPAVARHSRWRAPRRRRSPSRAATARPPGASASNPRRSADQEAATWTTRSCARSWPTARPASPSGSTSTWPSPARRSRPSARRTSSGGGCRRPATARASASRARSPSWGCARRRWPSSSSRAAACRAGISSEERIAASWTRCVRSLSVGSPRRLPWRRGLHGRVAGAALLPRLQGLRVRRGLERAAVGDDRPRPRPVGASSTNEFARARPRESDPRCGRPAAGSSRAR